MELISHLGLRYGPHPTPRRLVYKTWSVIVCFLLLGLLLLYHLSCIALSAWAYVVPTWAEYTKRHFIGTFWQVTGFFVRLNNVNIEISGDKLVPESALVISNHQSVVDYYLMQHLARASHPEWSPQVNFFTWYSLWSMPTARTLLNVMLCDENWDLSKSLCRPMFRKVVTSEAPQWVVVFPEVNIWSPAAAYSQRLQARRYFLPFYDHTLYPRYSGVMNAVNTLDGGANIKFSKLYNITIMFHNTRPPTLLQMFASTEPISVTIHVKVLPLANIPHKKIKLEKWLEKTWSEKDNHLAEMKAAVAVKPRPGKEAPVSLMDKPLSTFFPLTHLA